MKHIELERLVSAAAIDHQFRELLLRDPLRAAESYHSERFFLTTEEKVFLGNIQTSDFNSFVQIVASWIILKRSDNGAQGQAVLIQPSMAWSVGAES